MGKAKATTDDRPRTTKKKAMTNHIHGIAHVGGVQGLFAERQRMMAFPVSPQRSTTVLGLGGAGMIGYIRKLNPLSLTHEFSGGLGMNILGADFVLFRVKDIQKAIGFYRDFLGLPLEFYKEEWKWAEFNAGNVTLTLCGGHESSGGIIALAVSDLETAWQEVQEKGIKIKRPLHELSTCWHLEICDPDGNTIILHRRKDGSFGQN